MKKFLIICQATNNAYQEAEIFISNDCSANNHPIQYQNDWLTKEEGLTVPHKLMAFLTELQTRAKTDNKALEDVCELNRHEIEKQW
jgi:hypothetical protein